MVVELSEVREDMTEASLSDPLLANYPGSFWPAVHTVRQDQASPCVCLTVVKFLTTGHILAFTDMDWQKKLVILAQELQLGQLVPLQTGARDLQAGHMVMVSKADMQLSTPPLHQFILARAVVLSLSTEEDTARLYLVDHGMQATISTNRISALPPSLKTLPPRLVLCRVQGITPTPSTKLLAQSIITLSHLINSATAATILLRPTLATPKTLCQLLSSQQTNLITPSMDILHVLASTQTSLKHLITSNKNIPCMAMELIIPSMLSMLSSCHQTTSLRTVCTALETIHCLLVPLLPDQQRKVFSDGKVGSVCVKWMAWTVRKVILQVGDKTHGKILVGCYECMDLPRQVSRLLVGPYRITDIGRTPQEIVANHTSLIQEGILAVPSHERQLGHEGSVREDMARLVRTMTVTRLEQEKMKTKHRKCFQQFSKQLRQLNKSILTRQVIVRDLINPTYQEMSESLCMDSLKVAYIPNISRDQASHCSKLAISLQVGRVVVPMFSSPSLHFVFSFTHHTSTLLECMAKDDTIMELVLLVGDTASVTGQVGLAHGLRVKSTELYFDEMNDMKSIITKLITDYLDKPCLQVKQMSTFTFYSQVCFEEEKYMIVK